MSSTQTGNTAPQAFESSLNNTDDIIPQLTEATICMPTEHSELPATAESGHISPDGAYLKKLIENAKSRTVKTSNIVVRSENEHLPEITQI